MTRARRLAVAALAAAALGGGGCASTPEGPEGPPTVKELARPEKGGPPGAGPVVHVGETWLAVKTSPCQGAVDALAAYAALPGVVVPRQVRVRETGSWCALRGANDSGKTRADSWAQSVSDALKVPAIAFYTTDGGWSWSVYDRGAPLAAMESEYGAPRIVGDATAAGAALGVSGATLESYLADAKRPGANRELAATIGFSAPDARDAAYDVVPPPPSADAVPEDDLSKPPAYEAGQWVVMPPLGVMLVKGVEQQTDPEGKPRRVYLMVAGANQLPVPVAAAGRLHVRRLATYADAEKVLAQLDEDAEVPDARQYVEPRVRGWLDALKRGDLGDIARAFKQLCAVRKVRPLYAIESGLLDSTRAWLLEELTAARNVPTETTEQALDESCE
ncbi:MAG: hypothetical protein H6745_26415 [Deltaproteobacteria bacterium]|nr:hypothetical protein [Deltaproteobacteria bacterium]